MCTPRKHAQRRGYSLLEALAAGVIMAIVLVPTYTSMRYGLELSRDAETLQTTTTLCVGKMEEHLAITAATFASGTFTGDFAADGFDAFKYSVVRTDDPSAGGIADRLMVITAVVWKDDDADDALDAGEIDTQLKTNVAKMAVYIDGS